MINIDKIIKNIFEENWTIKKLFDSANILMKDGDPKSIHDFLEIGHLPKVNKIIYKNLVKIFLVLEE